MSDEEMLFRRQVRVAKYGCGPKHLETVNVEPCVKRAGCRGTAGEICPNCNGAVLTIDELRFLQLPKVGRMREPGED